jgi:hypothetical protein
MTEGYLKIYVAEADTSHTPEEGAHSPNWPNRLVIIIIIIIITYHHHHQCTPQRACSAHDSVRLCCDSGMPQCAYILAMSSGRRSLVFFAGGQ